MESFCFFEKNFPGRIGLRFQSVTVSFSIWAALSVVALALCPKGFAAGDDGMCVAERIVGHVTKLQMLHKDINHLGVLDVMKRVMQAPHDLFVNYDTFCQGRSVCGRRMPLGRLTLKNGVVVIIDLVHVLNQEFIYASIMRDAGSHLQTHVFDGFYFLLRFEDGDWSRVGNTSLLKKGRAGLHFDPVFVRRASRPDEVFNVGTIPNLVDGVHQILVSPKDFLAFLRVEADPLSAFVRYPKGTVSRAEVVTIAGGWKMVSTSVGKLRMLSDRSEVTEKGTIYYFRGREILGFYKNGHGWRYEIPVDGGSETPSKIPPEKNTGGGTLESLGTDGIQEPLMIPTTRYELDKTYKNRTRTRSRRTKYYFEDDGSPIGFVRGQEAFRYNRRLTTRAAEIASHREILRRQRMPLEPNGKFGEPSFVTGRGLVQQFFEVFDIGRCIQKRDREPFEVGMLETRLFNLLGRGTCCFSSEMQPLVLQHLDDIVKIRNRWLKRARTKVTESHSSNFQMISKVFVNPSQEEVPVAVGYNKLYRFVMIDGKKLNFVVTRTDIFHDQMVYLVLGRALTQTFLSLSPPTTRLYEFLWGGSFVISNFDVDRGSATVDVIRPSMIILGESVDGLNEFRKLSMDHNQRQRFQQAVAAYLGLQPSAIQFRFEGKKLDDSKDASGDPQDG